MAGDLFPILFANLCGGIFVLALLGLGIYLIMFGMRSKKKAEESQGWPATNGTITATEVKRSVNRDDDGHESYAYYPAVEYTYQVGTQTFTSKRLGFGGILAQKDPSVAQKAIQRYPVGGPVTVYYDPAKPSDAVLERQAGGLKWALVVGSLCLLLSLCIACPLLFGLISNIKTITTGGA
jgi:hypothetical protein